MSSFNWRKEYCNKSLLMQVIDYVRHEKKSGHLPQKKETFIVPEFDESKG